MLQGLGVALGLSIIAFIAFIFRALKQKDIEIEQLKNKGAVDEAKAINAKKTAGQIVDEFNARHPPPSSSSGDDHS